MDLYNISISNLKLRDAIYEAFEGKCVYTGQPVNKEDMAIDHVRPKSKGGRDSIYNYALTSRRLNVQKSNKLEEVMITPLEYIVRTVYAPKVIKLLKPKKIVDVRLFDQPHMKEPRQEVKRRQERAEFRRAVGEFYLSVTEESKAEFYIRNECLFRIRGFEDPMAPWVLRPDDEKAEMRGDKNLDRQISDLTKLTQETELQLKKAEGELILLGIIEKNGQINLWPKGKYT